MGGRVCGDLPLQQQTPSAMTLNLLPVNLICIDILSEPQALP